MVSDKYGGRRDLSEDVAEEVIAEIGGARVVLQADPRRERPLLNTTTVSCPTHVFHSFQTKTRKRTTKQINISVKIPARLLLGTECDEAEDQETGQAFSLRFLKIGRDWLQSVPALRMWCGCTHRLEKGVEAPHLEGNRALHSASH